MTDEIQPRWVVRRDGSAHEVLTGDGTWGTIEHAMWFDSHEDALAAERPPGTTGTAVQQHPEAAGA
jgi:hypothetical protein